MIGRTPTYGGAYRLIYNQAANCEKSDLNSNLIADDQYLYWISIAQDGLVRLPKDANTIDTPEWIASMTISGPGYLTQHLGLLYFLNYTDGTLYFIDKATFTPGYAVVDACSVCSKAIVTDDYYYVKDANNLLRYRTDNLQVYNIESGVEDFAATNYTVWFAKGDSVYLHDNLLDGEYPIYTSVNPSASIFDLVLKGNFAYFFEQRNTGCIGLKCIYDYRIIRKAWEGSGPADELVLYPADSNKPTRVFTGLSASAEFLFFEEDGVLYRLPQDAAALPKQNMWITGMEVTQAIQTADNKVGLVAGKRTFVRLHVRSDTSPVSGVSAYLYRTNAAGVVLGAPLAPVNPGGKNLSLRYLMTVSNTPDRDSIYESFLFELPWDVLTGTQYYYAVLNPNQYPLEPNFADNRWPAAGSQTLVFKTSPRLETVIVQFGYTWNNQNWYPSLKNDITPAYSFIRRLYPLSSTPGFASDPSPGFRPTMWTVLDDNLGTRVDHSDPSCAPLDDPELCASAYTNSLLATMRTTDGVADDIFMYGMISDRAGFFPRGQAPKSGNLSSGPAGAVGSPPHQLGLGWDNDTTYADWYAAHEIGHSLGRKHPNPASAACGHSADDSGYTYPNAEISPAGGAYAGFDAGDQEKKLPKRVIPGNIGHDIMSYCSEQWISDYTYLGIYNRLTGTNLTPIAQAGTLLPAQPGEPRIPDTVFIDRPKIAGDFLSVAGMISTNSNAASLQVVRHLSQVASLPDLVIGAYAVVQKSGAGSVLASDPFSPSADDDAGMLSFHQVVDFAPGAAAVEITRLADGKMLAGYPLSANPPSISNVTLVNPTNPVTGTVTLSWTAGDPDGDNLRFDIAYSRDNGLTFIPLQMGVQGGSAQVDAGRLGGSDTAIFRVTASDGFHQAGAESAPFVMAPKPPSVQIVTPEDGFKLQYGQPFNLAAEADDPQNGSLLTYSWKTLYGTFASGRLASIASIGVGPNVITVTATNSHGLGASASIHIEVYDDLNLPGPTLAVGPESLVFHAGASATAAQSAGISIANTGSGTLDWSASENAAWLSLETVSGSAPATLLVHADPGGLTAGQTYVAQVTISSAASGSSFVVPVAFSIGNVWNPVSGSATEGRMFLPLIVK